MSKKHSLGEQLPVFGIGFYRREQWPRLLETADDRKELEGTFDEWKLNLKKSVINMRASGVTPLKVDIDMEELLSWCKGRGFKNTGENRSECLLTFSGRAWERRSRNRTWNDQVRPL